MGREPSERGASIDPVRVEAWLAARGHAGARVVSLDPLGRVEQAGRKAYGYGKPLRITFESEGGTRHLVLRTMSPDPFGHDRRSDRAAVLLDAYDVWRGLPGHVQPVDVGAFDEAGTLVPMATGEVWLVTEYVEGRLYAEDLHALEGAEAPAARDVDRAEALAAWLAALHRRSADPGTWRRNLRDTVGSGEGLFGICDNYPAGHPVATADRLCALEEAAVRARWRLRDRARRARRTHGDFHPFNLLFREGTEFSVLDASRGGAGEPADDVTCLSVNYLFFALTSGPAAGDRPFGPPFRPLWDRFWRHYLDRSGDDEVLELVAPFFAWRALVVASPVWYPDVADAARERLLRFAENLLDGRPFTPDRVDELLS